VVLTFQPRDGVLGTADSIFAEPKAQRQKLKKPLQNIILSQEKRVIIEDKNILRYKKKVGVDRSTPSSVLKKPKK
jgi:hypothetical protein